MGNHPGLPGPAASEVKNAELTRTFRDGLSKVPSTDSSGSNQGEVEVDDRAVEALIRLGDIDFILGRAAEARSEFSRRPKMAERVSQTNPKSALIRRQLAFLRSGRRSDLARVFRQTRAGRGRILRKSPCDPALCWLPSIPIIPSTAATSRSLETSWHEFCARPEKSTRRRSCTRSLSDAESRAGRRQEPHGHPVRSPVSPKTSVI